MATANKSTQVMASEFLEQMGENTTESNANMLQCPSRIDCLAIFWDMENCCIPVDVRPEDVEDNIRMALQPVIRGDVKMFSAYADFSLFSKSLREGLQRTGVKLIDIPNGRKDASDKAILVDMLLFALDNPPPFSIMLISGDSDFAPTLHILGQRGYTVIPVIPAGVVVSSALRNAGKFVWEWRSLARGEGFVPPSKALVPPRGGSIDNSNGPNKEEATLEGLKGQLKELVEICGGKLPLLKVAAEYQKNYTRPLRVAQYGAKNMVDLFKKMDDTMTVKVVGFEKVVYLINLTAGPSAPPLSPAKKDRQESGGGKIISGKER